MGQLLHALADLREDLGFQFVLWRKHLDPFRNVELNLADREFVEDVFQYLCDVFFAELFAVCGDRGHAVFVPQFPAEFLGFFFVWCLGVDKDQEWFALFF